METTTGLFEGGPAPSLTLHGEGGRRVSVGDLRGRFVVVAFASGPGVPEAALADLRSRLRSVDAAAFLVFDDHAHCLEPTRAVAPAYGPPGPIAGRTYGRPPPGGAGIAVAVIDPQGIVRFVHASSAKAGDAREEIAEMLRSAAKRLCASRRPNRVAAHEWHTLAVVAAFALGFSKAQATTRANAPSRQGPELGLGGPAPRAAATTPPVGAHAT